MMKHQPLFKTLDTHPPIKKSREKQPTNTNPEATNEQGQYHGR